jgi:hypothetical protein
MDLFNIVVSCLLAIAALLFIINKWQDAKLKRDVYESLHPRPKVGAQQKKLSAIPFLFK